MEYLYVEFVCKCIYVYFTYIWTEQVIHEPTGTVLSARGKDEVLKADELLKWNTACFEDVREKALRLPVLASFRSLPTSLQAMYPTQHSVRPCYRAVLTFTISLFCMAVALKNQ